MSVARRKMADQIQPGMQCVEVEALLADALDGTLHGSTLAAFEAHRDSCPACRTMVEEAGRGLHWLKGLDEAEPPRHLVHNILAQTIGQIPEPRTAPARKGEGWLARLKGKLSPVFAPMVTPRFAMSFGMAFFSITMLLSIAGLPCRRSAARGHERQGNHQGLLLHSGAGGPLLREHPPGVRDRIAGARPAPGCHAGEQAGAASAAAAEPTQERFPARPGTP